MKKGKTMTREKRRVVTALALSALSACAVTADVVMRPGENNSMVFENSVLSLDMAGTAQRNNGGITRLHFLPAAADMIDRNRVFKNILGENWDKCDVNGVQGGMWFPHLAVYAPLAKGASADGRALGLQQEFKRDYSLRRTTVFRRDASFIEVEYAAQNISGAAVGGAFRFFNAFFPGALTGTSFKSTDICLLTENGIAELDQSVHSSKYKEIYKDTRHFNEKWAQEPLRAWTPRELQTPRLTGNWVAEVNRNNGCGVVLLVDPATLVGFYNDPMTTLEIVTRAFALQKGERWTTRFTVGVFKLPKGAKLTDANALFVSCTGGVVPLFKGTLEVGGKKHEASPDKLIAVQDVKDAKAFDSAGASLGVLENGAVKLAVPEIVYAIPEKPSFFGKVYNPEKADVKAFLARRDYTVYCGSANHPDVKAKAKRVALKLGVGFAEGNPGGKLLAFGDAEADEVVRNIGLMQNSVSDQWPAPGEGAIRCFKPLDLTGSEAVVVAGRDRAGLDRAMDKWEAQHLGDLKDAAGWTVKAVPTTFRAFIYSRPDASASDAVRVTAAKGEYESAQLLLVPYEDVKNIQVSVSEPVHTVSGKPLVKKFITTERKRNGHCRVRWLGQFPCDIKPELLPSRPPDPLFDRAVQTLPAGQAQGIWLTFLVPEAAESGLYTAEITVAANGEKRVIPVELKVRDFVLPRDGMMGEAYAAISSMPKRGSPLAPSHIDTYITNLLEHGMRMIRLRVPGMFRAHGSQEGAFKGASTATLEVSDDGRVMLDCSEFDRIMLRSEAMAKPYEVFYTLMIEDVWPQARELKLALPERHAAREGNVLLNSRYTEELLALLRKHLEKRGWFDRIYLSVSDEPGNVEKWERELCQAALGAGFRITTAHGSSDLSQARPDLCAIWKPIYGSYDEAFMKKARAAGSKLAFYNCGPPPTTALGAPLEELRNYLWQASKYDLDLVSWWGIQCWSTDTDDDGPGSLWRNYYGHWNYLIYPEHPVNVPFLSKEDGWKDARFIDSVRWETLRDGMEDTRYVTLLRRLIAAARSKKLGEEADAAQKVLDAIFAKDYPHMNAYRVPYPAILENREVIAGQIESLQRRIEVGFRQIFHLDLAFAKYRGDYLKDFLPQLRKWGYNTLLWELEDAVRFDTCPEIASPDAMSKAELGELLAFARGLGFENIPLLQTLSHNAYVLRHEKYYYLSEEPKFLELYCLSRPETGQFLIRLSDEIISLFGDIHYFHIGADEAWAIGRVCTTCKGHVEQFGAGHLMAKHLAPITSSLLARGVRPVMWADMVHTHPDLKALLDRRTVMADWYYARPAEAFRTVGGTKSKTDVFTEAVSLRKSGFEVWGCSAARCYGDSVFASKYDAHAQNYRRWLQAAVEGPLDGVMLTSWSVHLYPLELQAPTLALAGYDGLSEAQYEQAFASDCFGIGGAAFFRAVRILSEPVYLGLTHSVGHNQVVPEAPADAVGRALGKLSKEERARHASEAGRLLARYREAASILADLQGAAKKNAKVIQDWRLAADNLIFRARVQQCLLSPTPDGNLRKALLAELPALRKRTEAMYRQKVRPANVALIIKNLFDPVQAALQNDA